MTATEETPTEETDLSSRAAGGCVAVIGAAVAGTIVYAVPETGYFVAGLLATRAVSKTRTWAANRRQNADEEPEQVDIVAVIQKLGKGGNSVLLTAVKDAARLPNTKAARVLLKAAGIRIRAGVRTPHGNGPGIHHTDIPAPSPTTSDPTPGRCSCRSEAANANTNNGPHLVQDDHNPNRWHVIKENA